MVRRRAKRSGARQIAVPSLETDGEETLERLRLLRGGAELLELAAGRDDVELIGGAVRDLMLGREPREIDVVLDGAPGSFPHSAVLFARELAERLPDGAQVSFHQRFGTAAVRWEGARVDIAARRQETYAAPGALPDVAPGCKEQDLARRDFTVNAIAICLGGAGRGALRHVDGALEDLRSGTLRVLHDGSFLDDPTRMMRLCRYAARLGFAIEERTHELAADAIAAGAMDTVSGTRIGAELRLAAGESDPIAALAEMRRLGVLRALHPRLSLDERMAASALDLLPADGRPDLLVMSVAMLGPAGAPADDGPPAPVGPPADDGPLAPVGPPADDGPLAPVGPPVDVEAPADDGPLADFRAPADGAPAYARAEVSGLLERWEFPATDREVIVEAAVDSASLAGRISSPSAGAPSGLWETLRASPVEAVALAGAIGQRRGDRRCAEAARRWLSRLRHVRLSITGDDLLDAGLAPGPEIGARLEQVLRLRLDGKIEQGREAELGAALGTVRSR